MSSVNNVKTSYLKFMLTINYFLFLLHSLKRVYIVYLHKLVYILRKKRTFFTTSLWNHEPKCLLNFMFSCPLRFQLWLVHFSGSICIFYSFKSLCFSNTFTVLCSSPENPSVTFKQKPTSQKSNEREKLHGFNSFPLASGE